MEISVIICTHNPRADYLQRVLDALKGQTLPRERWELLLIDNASREPLAKQWDLSWHPQARHIREEELGLTPARLRGIKESDSDIIIFLDDDNIAATDYLAMAQGLLLKHPNLGCLGAGKLEPEFEEKPSEDLIPYLAMLALRTVNEPRWSNWPTDEIIPWGAGLAIRREIGKWYCESINSCSLRPGLDRRGTQLNSCGDDEFSWVACEHGYGKGIFSELKITHLIERRRVQLDYLLRIAEGHAFSHAMLDYIHGRRVERPEDKPECGKVIKALFRASPSEFFHEGQRWWNSSRRKGVEIEFEKARWLGISRALETIQEFKSGGEPGRDAALGTPKATGV